MRIGEVIEIGEVQPMIVPLPEPEPVRAPAPKPQPKREREAVPA